MIGCRAPRRTGIAVGLLTAASLTALSLTAGSSASRSGGSLSVSHVAVKATWKEGWLTGKLTFSVTVDAAASVRAFIRPAAGGPVGAKEDYSFTQGGTNVETIALPARLPPTTYVLRVLGTGGSSGLPKVDNQFVVPEPPEGVVDKASISKVQGGANLHVVKGPLTKIWVRFHFLDKPAAASVTVVWRTPSYKFVGEVTKPYAATIDSFLGSTAPLQTGVWYAILKVNGKIAKRIDLRIR